MDGSAHCSNNMSFFGFNAESCRIGRVRWDGDGTKKALDVTFRHP